MKHVAFLMAKILAFATTLYLITSAYTLALAETSPPTVDENLFKTLQNVPTFDLANPRLESRDYAPLGLKVITAPAQVKQTILSYEKTQANAASPNLNQCRLQAVNVETDNNANTVEWLVTSANFCTRLSPRKVKSFWLVQEASNGQLRVLLAERAYQVRIWQDKPSHNGRRLELMLQDNAASRYTNERLPVQCHAMYQFNGQHYTLTSSRIQVYREDPMSNGKAWRDVTGADPYAQVDDNFQCRAD